MSIAICRHTLASAIALIFASPLVAAAPVFYQGFDISAQTPPQAGCNRADFPGGAGTYPFPSDWLLRNVDNRAPAAAVSYVNEAWEVREDFSFDVSQCAAFSTSWYSPAGAADDWSWTPAIAVPAGASTLSWRAVTYDASYRDGYEVRVMAQPDTPTGGTGVIGNQITNSTAVFMVPAEETAWTQHTVDLSAYSGQTVYIGFHNNSTDKFLLLIDDVQVLDSTPDLIAQAPTGFNVEYSRVPAEIPVAATFEVGAYNGGGSPLTNVVATATVKRDGIPMGMPLLSNSIPSLAIGASAPVTFASSLPFNGSGQWSISYDLSATQTPSESNVLNNVIEVPATSIGGNEWARYEGDPSGTLGIGANNGGEIGTQFTLTQTATFEGVRFGMGVVTPPTPPDPDTWPGQDLVANLRAVDALGKPSTIIASTVAVQSTDAGGIYDVKFLEGPQTLMAGTYVVTVVEPTAGPAMPLFVSVDRFKTGTTWVNWPTSPSGGWDNLEAFGASFQRAPNISLLSEFSLFRDGFEAIPTGALAAQVSAAKPIIKSTRPLRKQPPKTLSTEYGQR